MLIETNPTSSEWRNPQAAKLDGLTRWNPMNPRSQSKAGFTGGSTISGTKQLLQIRFLDRFQRGNSSLHHLPVSTSTLICLTYLWFGWFFNICVILSLSRKKKKKKNMLQPVNRFPSPPPVDRVEEKFQEERKLMQLREMNEKTDLVLQRRRYTPLIKHYIVLFQA